MPPISKANPHLLRYLQQRRPRTLVQRHNGLRAYLERKGYKSV